ncbi:hypothetical protein KY290_007841 [Solanum tuberosum]|uniref:beta-ketoacyl-[acyl-carrier-protein] synthase I n=1 Tax=Solanum tuberosum TaxID=4113 RepID=A0ABQ7W8W7_SOLTU|nr:hypothetical protein KY290_007841 [Solanum tuberosum]
MVASSVASPLCTWLVAACMSVSSEKDQFWKPASNFQSSKLMGRSGRRRKAITKCNSGSLMNGSVMNSSWHTCFGFEPCEEYYKSEGLSASFSSLFAENAFSVFGFKQVPLNRRQRRMSSAAHSGKPVAVAVQPAMEATAKKKPLMRNRRVVVTGVGVVSPIGHDPDMFYNNLLEGISGISQIEAFDCSEFPSRIAGEIKEFSTNGWVAPKLSKRADKFMLYMLTAGKKALADGGITEDLLQELDKARCGVLIGSALGGMKVFYDGIEALQVSYKKLNPFCVPFSTSNMGAAMLAIDLGWMGPSYSISTACATSNFCILSAANHIIRGETDMMLCGGSDSAIIPIGLGGFTACGVLSQRNSDPTRASRPWDMDRDGFVIGEGSGVLLLEELEHAKKRKAKIYAEFLGGSFTSDAYHMIEPHPEGNFIHGNYQRIAGIPAQI